MAEGEKAEDGWTDRKRRDNKWKLGGAVLANPQIEDGNYSRLSNEILEALCRIRIPGEARQVFDFILRKTWGWNKREDRISLSQFTAGTGLKKPIVCRSITKLREMNLIIINNDNGNLSFYRINKDFESWIPLSKKKTLSKKIMSVVNSDNKPLSKMIHTKDNTDTITKDNTIPPPAKTQKTPPEVSRYAGDFNKWFFEKRQKHTDEPLVVNWAKTARITRSYLTQLRNLHRNKASPLDEAILEMKLKAMELFEPRDPKNRWLEERPKSFDYFFKHFNSIDISNLEVRKSCEVSETSCPS